MVHEGLRECGRRRRSAATQRLPRGVEGEEQRMKAGWIHPASSPSSGSLPVQNLDDCCERD